MSFRISHPELEGTPLIPERALPHYAARGWVLVDQVDGGSEPAAAPRLEQPAKSASAAQWRTYAVAIGDMTVHEAFAKTRDQLAELYNSTPADDGDSQEAGPAAVEMPTRNASTEAWRSYAAANGLTAEQADGMTRDELVEHFTATPETIKES